MALTKGSKFLHILDCLIFYICDLMEVCVLNAENVQLCINGFLGGQFYSVLAYLENKCINMFFSLVWLISYAYRIILIISQRRKDKKY